MKVLLIAGFGVLGVLSRYFIDLHINQNQESFPIATLAVNLVGCFLAGVIYCFIFQKYQSNLLQPLLIGFCGGLTTFSGYSLQTLNLLTLNQTLKSVSYLVLSPTLGILFVFMGFQLTLFLFFTNSKFL